VVWKNVEAGLTGAGDVDYLAPAEEWDGIEHDYLRWARDGGLGPVIVCRHVPSALFLVALPEPGSDDRWLQLDVRARVTFRGATVLRAGDAGPLAQLDERGFRRLRPGAEGLLKLVVSGIAPSGRPKAATLAKEGVAALLRSDPAGAEAAAAVFGPLAGAARRAARAAADGGWDRRAAAALQAWALARAPAAPAVLAGQVLARRAKATCPLLRTGIGAGRRAPEPRAEWVAGVARDHIVHGWTAPYA
jgi:hypothetical protein